MPRNSNLPYRLPHSFPPTSNIHTPSTVPVRRDIVHGVLARGARYARRTVLLPLPSMVHTDLRCRRSSLPQYTVDRSRIFTQTKAGECWQRCHCNGFGVTSSYFCRFHVMLHTFPPQVLASSAQFWSTCSCPLAECALDAVWHFCNHLYS